MMRSITVTFFVLFSAAALGSNLFQGTVVDSLSMQPIEYATVKWVGQHSGQILGGTTTNQEGEFEFQAPFDTFFIEVSFIGFITRRMDGFTASRQ